ncbi:MAG TPA: hypothetical protein PLF78_09635, partial [Caulobacter sp.]|nr:hypothetical protein [Caulobacter sp.]
MKPFGRGAPLFAQVLALVVLSMVLVHVVLAVLVFTLPPPPPELYRLADIAQALRAPGETKVEGARPLVVKVTAPPPPGKPPRPWPAAGATTSVRRSPRPCMFERPT